MVQSVVSCVKLLCERLAFIEPPEITDAIFNLRRACRTATQPELETSSLFAPEVQSMHICACIISYVCTYGIYLPTIHNFILEVIILNLLVGICALALIRK